MSKLVEDYPFLELGTLTREGLFADTACKSAITVKLGDMSVRVRRAACAHSLRAIITNGDGRARQQTIAIKACPTPYGVRRYFACPTTGKACNRLYLVDGHLASRDGHGLKFLSASKKWEDIDKARALRVAEQLRGSAGKGPARGERRDRLLSELATVRGAAWLPEDIVQLLKDADQRRLRIKAQARARAERALRRRERVRRSAENQARRLIAQETYAKHLAAHEADYARWEREEPFRRAKWEHDHRDRYCGNYAVVSTNVALAEGRKDWPEHRVAAFFRSFPSQESSADIRDPHLVGQLFGEEDWANFKPHLEIDALVEYGLFQPDGRHSAALRWHWSTRGIVDHYLVTVRTRDHVSASLLLWPLHERLYEQTPAQGQILNAVVDDAGVWWFVCPATGERVKTLYRRGSWWASLAGNNLAWQEAPPFIPREAPKFRRSR